MHVVVAVGEDETSRNALDWALKHVVNESRDKLTILTVVDAAPHVGFFLAANAAMYTPQFVDELRRTANARATKLVRDLRDAVLARAPAMRCEMIVGHGEPRDEIVDYLDGEVAECSRAGDSANAHLLIMGSRGLSAMKRTFLGSTSEYVLHHCPCPVLVVRPSAES